MPDVPRCMSGVGFETRFNSTLRQGVKLIDMSRRHAKMLRWAGLACPLT